MKAKFATLIAGFALICLLAISIIARQKTKEAEKLSRDIQLQVQGNGNGPQTAQRGLTAEQQFRQFIKFRRDVDRYFTEKDTLPPAERVRRGKDLMRQVDEREKLRHLNAGEAFKLKMGLIDAIEQDEQKRLEQIADLTAQYKAEAERRQAQFAAEQSRDPKFQAYKLREAQIVSEVTAMRSFPNGMSRDEYLRQRLLEARAAIYYTPGKDQLPPPVPVVR